MEGDDAEHMGGGKSGQAHDQTIDRRLAHLPKGADTKGLDAVIDAGFAYQRNPNDRTWAAYTEAFSKLTPEQKKAIGPIRGGGGGGGSRSRGGTNGTGGTMKGSPPGVNW